MREKDAMTKIQIGDLVRIGDLPAGAVVRGDSGYYLRVGEQCVSGDVTLYRARAGESDPGCPCPADATMHLISLPLPVEPQPTAPSFAALFDARVTWSRATFGDGERVATLTAHIRKELAEIEAAPADLEEWVDVAILAMDGAWRSAGADGAAFLAALVAKDAKNRARKWPAQHEMIAGVPTEHVRTDPPPTESEAVAAWHQRATDAQAALARVTAERDGFVAMLAEAADERIEAKAAATQVTALQEAAAENGRLRAECTRLRKVATGYATIPREREAIAKICDALGMGDADDRTPAGALQYIVSLRRQLATWQDEGTALYAAVDLRDAQEGDRLAAWAEASGLIACQRDLDAARAELAALHATVAQLTVGGAFLNGEPFSAHDRLRRAVDAADALRALITAPTCGCGEHSGCNAAAAWAAALAYDAARGTP